MDYEKMWNELKEYLLLEIENPENDRDWSVNYSLFKKMNEIQK